MSRNKSGIIQPAKIKNIECLVASCNQVARKLGYGGSSDELIPFVRSYIASFISHICDYLDQHENKGGPVGFSDEISDDKFLAIENVERNASKIVFDFLKIYILLKNKRVVPKLLVKQIYPEQCIPHKLVTLCYKKRNVADDLIVYIKNLLKEKKPAATPIGSRPIEFFPRPKVLSLPELVDKWKRECRIKTNSSVFKNRPENLFINETYVFQKMQS